jgi:DNA-binding NtrC family response regulator
MSAKRRVLFVDDDLAILEAMACTFRRAYDIVTAACAAAALELLARDPTIEVIVTDMRMPVMDGAALLARVMTQHPGIARILLTGTDSIECGAAARTLSKPCPRAELQRAIEAAAGSIGAAVCG